MDQEIPDYDMDSEDDSWLNEQSKKMEITPSKFEEMMDRLEKGSGQQVGLFILLSWWFVFAIVCLFSLNISLNIFNFIYFFTIF